MEQWNDAGHGVGREIGWTERVSRPFVRRARLKSPTRVGGT